MVKKTSTPIEQTARLLDLVPFLLTHQGIALEDLAKQFGVTQEVILDDLNTLWMCGLPGYTPLELIDLEFDSGYVTIRNADPLAKVRALGGSEMVALALGLDLLLNGLEGLPPEVTNRIVQLSERVRSVIGSQITITEAAQTQVRAVIDRAIAERANVSIAYFSPQRDEVKERIISPFGFFTEGSFEYVEAFCDLAGATRTFRLDRINSVSSDLLPRVNSSSKESVSSPKNSSPKNSQPQSTKARIMRGDRWTSESLGLSPGQVTIGESISLSAYSLDWLARTALGSCGDLVIDSPNEIRRSIVQSVESTLALYEEGAIPLAPTLR
jgi:proteasome accessory factor C